MPFLTAALMYYYVLFLPIGLQEMVMAIWLLAKVFNPSSVDGDADTLSRRNDGRKEHVGESPKQNRDDPKVNVKVVLSGLWSHCSSSSPTGHLRLLAY